MVFQSGWVFWVVRRATFIHGGDTDNHTRYLCRGIRLPLQEQEYAFADPSNPGAGQ